MEMMPEAQKRLWPTLGWTTMYGFVLYGGTAIALRCGHRASVDFDFFTDKPLGHQVIFQELKQSGITFQVVQDEKNSLTVLTAPDDVRVSFFGGLGMGRVGVPTRTEDGLVSVASPLDLLATNLKVILQRAEKARQVLRTEAAAASRKYPIPAIHIESKQLFGEGLKTTQNLKTYSSLPAEYRC